MGIRGLTTVPSSASAIRPFVESDLFGVAALHRRLYPDNPFPEDELRSHFRRMFFENPWYDLEFPSFVSSDSSGNVTGFLGVMPRRMVFQGRPIKVAVSAQLLVDPSSRSSLAGVQLLQKYFQGPQDLFITDGANDTARSLWEGLGGKTALLYSMDWTRPLRPGRYVTSLLSKRLPLGALAATPATALLDLFATRVSGSNFHLQPQNFAEDLTPAAMLENFSTFIGRLSLVPDYDHAALSWLIEEAARKKSHGSFRKVLVRNEKGVAQGWYLYYACPGGVSQVLQLNAKKHTVEAVLRHLFYHAWKEGSLAVRGRLVPRFLDELSAHQCMIQRGSSWTLVHSHNAELLQAIDRGDAFLSRLEAEWWMRFLGG